MTNPDALLTRIGELVVNPSASGLIDHYLDRLAQNMHLKLSRDGEVMEYTYRLGTREFRLDPLDVVHFKLPDPENFYRGHSPVQGIRYAVDTHKEADVMNLKRLGNNAVPAGIITTDGMVNQGQIDLIKAQWRQMYGGAENAGRTAVVPKGMDFKTVQQSNQEMQFAEGKQMTRDEVLAAYGVGLEIMGKTESQTRANAEAFRFVVPTASAAWSKDFRRSCSRTRSSKPSPRARRPSRTFSAPSLNPATRNGRYTPDRRSASARSSKNSSTDTGRLIARRRARSRPPPPPRRRAPSRSRGTACPSRAGSRAPARTSSAARWASAPRR